MEGVIIAAAVQFVRPEASALLKPLLHEVYTIVKYRIKGVDSLKVIEELVRKLDIEAKLDCVSVLISEIQSNSTTVQTAIRHIHVKLEEIKNLLEKLTQEAELHAKKWLSGWRTSESMNHLMKKLEIETKTLNDRVKFLLMLRPLTSPVVIPEALGHRHLLHPLEQSWMLMDVPNSPESSPPLLGPSFIPPHQLPDTKPPDNPAPVFNALKTQTLARTSDIEETDIFATQQDDHKAIGEQELKELEDTYVNCKMDVPIPLNQLKDTMLLQKERKETNVGNAQSEPSADKLTVLLGMGFVDEKLNREILSRADDNLQMAISLLVKS